MTLHWKILYYVLLTAQTGVPGLEAWEQISWAGQVTAGFSTSLTCSSSCTNCIYSWSFMGHNFNGSTLTWTPDGLDSTVTLQCNVLNRETGVSSTLTSIVEVKNQVSVVLSPPNAVPSLNESLDLVCHDATAGHRSGLSQLNQVVWYKDGEKVILGENMRLQQNSSLHFDSLLPSHGGFYQCETLVQQTTVFSLGYQLSYDAWTVNISGPDSVFPDKQSTFTCLTSCTLDVDCTVKWQFRGGFPMGTFLSVHKNKLRWTPSRPGTFQDFTCVAENTAAGRSAEATKTVEVKGVLVSGSRPVQLTGHFAMTLSLGLLLIDRVVSCFNV